MSRSGLTLSAFLITLFAAGSASAQYAGSPYSRPRVSPYINLLRGGSTPGVNYYGIVRPEVDARAAIGQVAQQAQQNQQAITGLQNTPAGALTTGHPFGFQNHWGYFQNLGSGGVPGGSGGGGSGAAGFGLGGASSGLGRGGMGGLPQGRSGGGGGGGGAASRPPSRGR